MVISIHSKKDVDEQLRRIYPDIKKLGVKRLGLFGSYVRDSQNPQSDIDILVEFEDGKKTFDNFMHLAFLLEEVLHQPVELVTKESLSPYIGPRILKEVEYVTVPE